VDRYTASGIIPETRGQIPEARKKYSARLDEKQEPSPSRGRSVIDIPVDNQNGIFTRTVDYSGENGYVFQVVSFDRFGNRSVSSETTAGK
jgi:hypothetical protein